MEVSGCTSQRPGHFCSAWDFPPQPPKTTTPTHRSQYDPVWCSLLGANVPYLAYQKSLLRPMYGEMHHFLRGDQYWQCYNQSLPRDYSFFHHYQGTGNDLRLNNAHLSQSHLSQIVIKVWASPQSWNYVWLGVRDESGGGTFGRARTWTGCLNSYHRFCFALYISLSSCDNPNFPSIRLWIALSSKL